MYFSWEVCQRNKSIYFSLLFFFFHFTNQENGIEHLVYFLEAFLCYCYIWSSIQKMNWSCGCDKCKSTEEISNWLNDCHSKGVILNSNDTFWSTADVMVNELLTFHHLCNNQKRKGVWMYLYVINAILLYVHFGLCYDYELCILCLFPQCIINKDKAPEPQHMKA